MLELAGDAGLEVEGLAAHRLLERPVVEELHGQAAAGGLVAGGVDVADAAAAQAAVDGVYFVGYETSDKQGTWGKQILGIKVTDLYGRRITTGLAVGRFFANIISNLTCGIGYLLPLFTDRKQTLHDLICGCLALKK
jgi:uncharacterized RDD family membrane protein YckC